MQKLNVPYLSQLDNTIFPTGTCNVTSVAMCCAFFGESVHRASDEQLEDYFTRYCLDNGLSRHSPGDLVILAQKHGYRPRFNDRATWGQVKAWLDSGKPCIVHGYFTSSGHIMPIVGYNDKGWIVHDPYGEWYAVHDPYGEWYASGYDTSVSGEGLTYSYKMMEDLCGPDSDSQLWIHFFDGPSEDKRIWNPGQFGGLRLQDIWERKLTISVDEVKKDLGLVRQIQTCLTRFPQFQPGTPDGNWGPVTQKAWENFIFSFQPTLGTLSIDATVAKVLIEGKYR